MVISLRRLFEAPLEVVGEIRRDDPLWQGTGIELALPLSVRARAEAAGGGVVRVSGTLATRARAQCRRCLKPLELEIAERFDLVFDPGASESEEDLALYRLDPGADELDLRDTVRERLILAVAEYPLCGDECRGLCPRCGADLNEEQCECATTEPDPRWGPLLAMRGGADAGRGE